MGHSVGVAIAVPEPYGEQLRSCRADFGDRQAASVPTHVTLLPPTWCDERGLNGLSEALEGVSQRHAPFEMTLCGTGTFRPVSPVVFVAVGEGVAATEKLAADVRGVAGAGDPPYPFHPHVTVAQDVPEAQLDRALLELADFDCRFEVSTFNLYVRDGQAWQCHREFWLR